MKEICKELREWKQGSYFLSSAVSEWSVMGQEIERKFRVKKLPEQLEQYEKKELEQGYLCVQPVVRIRKSITKSGEKYILCYKSKLKLEQQEDRVANTCEEAEFYLTEEAYVHLREKADGRLIQKTRYLIPLEQGLKIELDVFHGELEGLHFAEVEFPDEETAKQFVMPDWFLDDVTFDKRFKNNYIALAESIDVKELMEGNKED